MLSFTAETPISGQPIIYVYGHKALASRQNCFWFRMIQNGLCRTELTDDVRARAAISIIRQMSRFGYSRTETLLRVIPTTMNLPKAIEVELLPNAPL